MQGNITGSAQHKVKTINVEVNLLEAWADQRVELEAKVLKKFVLLTLITISGLIAIPLISMERSSIAIAAAKSSKDLSGRLTIKSELERKAKLVTPSIQMDDMILRCHRYSNSYLNELTRVINAAPTLMYFEQFQTEVANGECSIKVLATAANPDVGRLFVDVASKGKNVISATQTSARQGQLSESSVKFDFVKKVKL